MQQNPVSVEVKGIEAIRDKLENKLEIFLIDVLYMYIPELNENLISVIQIQKAGYTLTL